MGEAARKQAEGNTLWLRLEQVGRKDSVCSYMCSGALDEGLGGEKKRQHHKIYQMECPHENSTMSHDLARNSTQEIICEERKLAQNLRTVKAEETLTRTVIQKIHLQ